MKLVGATNWFIRWPFVIEGIICGLVGAVLSVALLWAVKVGVVDHWIDDTDSALTRDEATTIGFPLLGLILIAAGAARRRPRQRHHAAPLPQGLSPPAPPDRPSGAAGGGALSSGGTP